MFICGLYEPILQKDIYQLDHSSLDNLLRDLRYVRYINYMTSLGKGGPLRIAMYPYYVVSHLRSPAAASDRECSDN